MAIITGRVEVVVNGELLLNKAGASIAGVGVSGKPAFELTQISGDTGPHGAIETPVPATCTVTVSDRADIPLSDIAKIRENGTVIFRAARGGKSYTLFNASCQRNFTVTAGEGEVELIFFGPFWTETSEAEIGV